MATFETENIRNLALVGHSGSGKTTLAEALLVASGTIGSAGEVERGTTVADFDPLEKEHGHSLNSSILHLEHRNALINLLDTPGYPDFRGATLSAMGAVETAAIVVNAQAGIELNVVRMMQRAKARKTCRLLIINKIDSEDIDLTQLVRDLRTQFGDVCLPINLPAGNGTSVSDVFFHDDGEADIFSVEAAHTEITDQVVEVDEELMGQYFEGEKLDRQLLHDAFERCMRRGHLVPICFVSARTGVGVPELLDLIVKLMPNPMEGNPPAFLLGESDDAEEILARPDPDAHVLAHVFKVTNDPFVGKLSVFRIYQGTVNKDTQLYVGDARKPFKVNHLLRMQGKELTDIDSAGPGEICAVAKVDDIHHDAILHDSHDEDHYRFKPIDFPQPMFGLAIEPKSRGHEQKISMGLHRLAEEDPCFEVEHSAELNETVIRGLGDMHLRILLEVMSSRYGVEVITRPPRIAYRETITTPAEGHARHKKQTGGAGQFGEVYLRIKPLPRGSGFEFSNDVVGGAIPSGLVPAVEKGVRQIMDEGAIAGYPLQDVFVSAYDGKHHPVDSKEVAFVAAGRKAFLKAIESARPQVLEPVVDVHVVVPDSYMGDVTGALAAKRARISGTDTARGGMLEITAQVPLSELSDFQTELKSMTGGQGRYTMEFSRYDPVPAQVQSELIREYRPKDED